MELHNGIAWDTIVVLKIYLSSKLISSLTQTHHFCKMHQCMNCFQSKRMDEERKTKKKNENWNTFKENDVKRMLNEKSHCAPINLRQFRDVLIYLCLMSLFMWQALCDTVLSSWKMNQTDDAIEIIAHFF